jgi:hypothetical protein
MNYWLEKAVHAFHRSQGYIFVELVVTIAITGIVMGTLATGFSQFSSDLTPKINPTLMLD